MSSEAYIVLLESSIEDLQRALAAERARRIKAEEVVDRLLKQKFAVIDSLTVWLGVIQKVASEYRAQYPRVEQEKPNE